VRFLNYLANDRNVAASTQNQALSALVFLYKEVLDKELGDLSGNMCLHLAIFLLTHVQVKEGGIICMRKHYHERLVMLLKKRVC